MSGDALSSSPGKTGIRQALKDFLFGALVYGMYRQVVVSKAKYNDVLMTLIMGEFIGIPLLGNYFTLRLLPYIYGDLESARRRVLRDVDFLELMSEGPSAH